MLPSHSDGFGGLVSKLADGTLSSEEEASLCDILETGPELVRELNLTPDKVPLLVENYPNVALKLLLAVDTSPNRDEYGILIPNVATIVHSCRFPTVPARPTF
jgi:hypothetical protein